jgi:PAS domain S-box-containing protein
MPDSIILTDIQRKVLEVNQSLSVLLGYAEDELIGKSVDMIFKEEPFARTSLEILLQKNELKNYETKRAH